MATSEHTVSDRAESSLSNPWIWLLSGMALATIALVWLRLGGDAPVRLVILLAGLLAAGIGVRFTLRPGRSPRFEAFGSVGAESAALLVLCGIIAFLGCWALWHGNAAAGEWDTLRLFLAVVAVMALLAAPLLLVPRVVQKVVVSVFVVLHFGGILTAVLGAPPGPWFMQMLWSRVYRPYLEFMYLTNAYRFYSPEPGPASQLWCRLVYADEAGHQYVRWLKVPETEEPGQHTYTIALRNQRRQSLVDNVSNMIARTQPSLEVARAREQQTPRGIARGVFVGEKGPKGALNIPYYSDRRFPEDEDVRLPQYAEPAPYGKELLQSYARYLARLPYPNHPEYRFHSVKIYRAQHRILSAPALAHGADPYDLTFYLPYYQGQFDARGKLDPEDPFLYWLVPIMRDDPADRNSPIKAYVFLHAGDQHDWIKNQAPKFQLPPP